MITSKKQRLAEILSMESEVDGIRKRELEYTFYGQVQSLQAVIDGADHREVHEQWGIDLDTDRRIKMRIRAIDDKRYVLTTKEKVEAQLGVLETECEISKDMFETLRKIGTGGYRKTRYTFKDRDSGLNWEIDVFKNPLGQDSDWVKLDLEVSGPDVELPKLPVSFLTVITHQSKELTVEEKAVIDRLWNKDWVSIDPDLKLKV